MLDALIRWSLHHRAVVLFLATILLIWGGYSIREAPLDVLPDLTAPTVTILVEARGMVPTEMESLVTFPIESAINGAPGVRRVRSATAVGVAVIWVEFDWGQEIHRARQTVNEKLSLVSASLPPNVDKPFLAPISSIMGEILFITLESSHHSPMELRTVAETVLRRRILAVPGVAQVVSTGGDQKQYQVLVSPQLLREYEISLDEVETALRQGSLLRRIPRRGRAGIPDPGCWPRRLGGSHRAHGGQVARRPAYLHSRCCRRADRSSVETRRRIAQCCPRGLRREISCKSRVGAARRGESWSLSSWCCSS